MTAPMLCLARLGDAPRIAQMSRTLIEAGLPWSWTPRRVASYMRRREHLAVIATTERELSGFVLAQFGGEAVHVALLGVIDHRQRAGLGRQLVQWVEESATVAGLFVMRLEVRSSNHAARRFYAALGYAECGRTNGYYNGIEDAVRLSRDLRAARGAAAGSLPGRKPLSGSGS